MHPREEKHVLGVYRSKLTSIRSSFPIEIHRARVLRDFCKNNNKNQNFFKVKDFRDPYWVGLDHLL